MYVTTANRKYWVEEEGTGPPLFLLHGFTGSCHSFDKIKPSLSSKFRVISIDMPGHGNTGEIGPVSMEDFTVDLKQIIEHFSYKSVHLLGYSMGGRSALSFAMLYPQYVNLLMLESASPGLETLEEQLARQSKDQHHIDKLLEQGLNAFVQYWENIPLFSTQRKLPESVSQQLREERLSHTARGLAQSLEGMGTGTQPSWWPQLPNLNKRILLVTGEKDEKFVKLNQRMNNLLPGSELITVKGAGHAIHVEDPKAFAKIVEEFML
ncbi:2-succinyl-6-hydroxy-2,4-cyclohexadiene-1-carboxylate synthase [Halobacillus andaensis]|uniref:2-succinyl-6-hydroxy-2, 4-cyclohexadiene-1-carboxylate synthase n=1 Tax=Halobacillus andaensis TaxID=1176239 RepID=UPI003D747355